MRPRHHQPCAKSAFESVCGVGARVPVCVHVCICVCVCKRVKRGQRLPQLRWKGEAESGMVGLRIQERRLGFPSNQREAMDGV